MSSDSEKPNLSETTDLSKSSKRSNPILWLMIGLPLAVVIAGISMIVVASKSGSNDAVIDNVSRVSQMQTTDLSPDTRAAELDLRAIVRIEDGVVEVLPALGKFDRQQPLVVRLSHPTQAEFDQTLNLIPTEQGWKAEAKIEDSHDWLVELTNVTKEWRVRGRLPKEQHAVLVTPILAGKS